MLYIGTGHAIDRHSDHEPSERLNSLTAEQIDRKSQEAEHQYGYGDAEFE